MLDFFEVLVVGAGHAGAQATIALRQRGYSGTLCLLGDEPELPYQRPPLSKDYLAGDRPFERLLIRPRGFWQERDIALQLGTPVTALDPILRCVMLSDGRTVFYGTLIWATGGAPRRLSCQGHDLAGVHSMRTRADADRVLSELAHVDDVVVVGGGYIGLEAAAVLIELGKRVTVLEAQDRVLARVAGAPISTFFEAEHRAHGVDVRTGIKVACIEERDGAACGVRLESGVVLPTRLVIVGIGIVPAVQPLLAAGAQGNDGVAVDELCRTSLPSVYAIGDCAEHQNAFARGASVRVESVQNANDQATTVAKALTGQPEPYRAIPWFWSNQYDLRLQTVGLSLGYDTTVLRGSPRARSFSVVYVRDERVAALDCVNASKDFAHGRAIISKSHTVTTRMLADTDVPLSHW
jgi:3-phenylpropionate/trans-cinnamate dioxygenase ferredoxin reductase subunit